MRDYHIFQQQEGSSTSGDTILSWLDGGVVNASNGDAAMKKYAADRDLDKPVLLAIPESDYNPGRVTLKKREPVVVVERTKAQSRPKKTAAAAS